MGKYVIERRGNLPKNAYLIRDSGLNRTWGDLERADLYTLEEACDQLRLLSERCIIRKVEEETVEEKAREEHEPCEISWTCFEDTVQVIAHLQKDSIKGVEVRSAKIIFDRVKTTTKRKVVE